MATFANRPELFDFSSIHPAHGFAYDGSFAASGSKSDNLSAAETILAALAADSADLGEESDLVMDDGEGGESSDSSFSSLETPGWPLHGGHLPRSKEDGEASYFPANNTLTVFTSSGLERISSCGFVAPTGLLQDTLAPVDLVLQAQLSGQRPETIFTSVSLIPTASTSSGMMRSYSAPAYTASEFAALQARWNAEASVPSTSTSIAVSTPSTASKSPSPTRPGMKRRSTASDVSSYSRASEGSGLPISAGALSSPTAVDERVTSGEEGIQSTFSSRTHLLSPTKKHSPFKRSRLCYSTSYHSIIPEDPRENDFDTTPAPGRSPPKSPTRPSLNRHFTSPEFWAGGQSTEEDDIAAENSA